MSWARATVFVHIRCHADYLDDIFDWNIAMMLINLPHFMFPGVELTKKNIPTITYHRQKPYMPYFFAYCSLFLVLRAENPRGLSQGSIGSCGWTPPFRSQLFGMYLGRDQRGCPLIRPCIKHGYPWLFNYLQTGKLTMLMAFLCAHVSPCVIDWKSSLKTRGRLNLKANPKFLTSNRCALPLGNLKNHLTFCRQTLKTMRGHDRLWFRYLRWFHGHARTEVTDWSNIMCVMNWYIYKNGCKLIHSLVRDPGMCCKWNMQTQIDSTAS